MASEESTNTDKTTESNSNGGGLGALASSMLSAAAFISKAPMRYTDTDKFAKSALQFQPRTTINRNNGKQKNKGDGRMRSESSTVSPLTPEVKASKLDDWIDKDDGEEQQGPTGIIAPFDLRKYKKRRWIKRNKRRRQEEEDNEINPDDVPWEDEYLIDQPNNYLVYMESDERFMEDEDWRQYLLRLKDGRSKERQEPDQSELDLEPEPEILGAQEHDDQVEEEEEEEKGAEEKASSLPGQKQFAQREMAKYGWVKGKGLGNSSHGITQALQVSIDKTNRGHGKIINKSKQQSSTEKYNHPFEADQDSDGEEGKFGKTSSVIILRDMVSYEDAMTDESLAEEIGQECDSKYGPVERVFIHTIPEQESSTGVSGANIYVKFTSELAALGAVNGLNGRMFGGSRIQGRFYGAKKFARSIYSNVL